MANEILKSKGVLIGGAVVGVIAIGGVAAYVISNQNSAAPAATADAGPPPGAPASPPVPGAPGGPAGAPPTVAQPKPAAASKTQVAAVGPPKVLTNSWDEAGSPTSPTSPATPSTPGGPGAGPGAPGAPAAPAASDAAKPAPISQGTLAAGYRADPFVSFTRRLVEAIPAYQLIAHQRLASRPRPTPPAVPSDPNMRYGPLPQVERRIAGILFDGSVSAILETGTPGGSSTRVSVIQPGSLVPSGVPGLRDLTVASITTSEVVLRADDGRTTTVKLSSVPAAYAEAFRGAASGGDANGGGAPPQGPGGPPPGPGGPGGRKGGRFGGPPGGLAAPP